MWKQKEVPGFFKELKTQWSGSLQFSQVSNKKEMKIKSEQQSDFKDFRNIKEFSFHPEGNESH